MRMAELAGKEIINVYDGARLGVVGETDMVVDSGNGRIKAVMIPRRAGLINFWADRQYMIIPWESIKKIGREIIIVDLDQAGIDFGSHMV